MSAKQYGSHSAQFCNAGGGCTGKKCNAKGGDCVHYLSYSAANLLAAGLGAIIGFGGHCAG